MSIVLLILFLSMCPDFLSERTKLNTIFFTHTHKKIGTSSNSNGYEHIYGLSSNRASYEYVLSFSPHHI